MAPDAPAPRSALTIGAAVSLTAAVVLLGYVLLGLIPMLLFALGFVGGLVMWLVRPTAVSFADIRVPYWLTLGFFVLHKLEERYLDFFPALARLTGEPLPDTGSIWVAALYACAAAWLLVPYLVTRRRAFGHYLAWTFFASMGTVELAHFVFPLFRDQPYGYFPGMASVVLLAPAGWWGMARLARGGA